MSFLWRTVIVIIPEARWGKDVFCPADAFMPVRVQPATTVCVTFTQIRANPKPTRAIPHNFVKSTFASSIPAQASPREVSHDSASRITKSSG